ncbi:ATP-binding protein [Fibrella aquatilis]|uniref:ATP-binding protein n=1 Tax=Fibrella aquatilis TaxID=2817059 RepID=UPI00286E3CC6|nr:ATP-binding protein [Fibrella aquatilis]
MDRQLDRAKKLTSSQPEQALTAARSALSLAQKNQLTLSEGKAYQRLTRIYAERDDYVSALDAAKAGLSIFHKLGEQEEICRSYLAVGIVNRYMKLYDASIEANLQAQKIAEARQDTGMLGSIYGNLGNVYFDKKEYDQSLQLGLKALTIQTAQRDTQAMSNTFHNLARVYRIRREFGKALAFYNKSLAIDLKNDNQLNISGSYLDLALLFRDMGDFRQALQYSQRALAIAKRIESKNIQQQVLANLPLIYGVLGKPKEAVAAQEQYQYLTDSLQSAELSKQIADMQARYQGEQKDRELGVQKLRLATQQASLSQQHTLIVALVALALLAGLIGYLLFNRYKLQQRNQQLSLENEQYHLSRSLQLRQDIDGTINYFATSLYGKNTVDEILWDVAKNCIARLGFVDCVIYLLNDEQTALIQKAAYGNKNPEAYAIFNPIEIPLGTGIVGTVAVTGKPETIADTTQDPRYIVDDEVRYAELAVPLLLQNKVIGVIDSEHPQKGFFQEHHREALQTIAAICSSKIAQVLADEAAKEAKILQIEADYIKKLDRVKSQFFANISHEFRTPLQLILAPLQKRKAISPEETRMMERNANRLLRLVNQLLDLAKAEMGQLTLRMRTDDVIEFISQLAHSFWSLADNKEVRYVVDLPAVKLDVPFDRDKLEKIIYNLLANAIKFTPTGGSVSFRVVVEPMYGLRIEVADTGVGIPEPLHARIFDRFYQADDSQTRAFDGTGLGLTLTKELVELHKGSIQVDSREGAGSTFVVRLPLLINALRYPNVPRVDPVTGTFPGSPVLAEFFTPANSPEDLAETSRDDKPTLLLVEDHPELSNYLQKQLADQYRVIQAMQGLDGLQTARKLVPDVIVSDVMMPVMDGFSMTRHLKEDDLTSHIPVILLTAKDDVDSRTEGFEGGAEQYLAKPFALDELVARISSVLTQRDLLRKKYSREVVLQPTGAPIRDREAEFLEKVIGVIEQYMADDAFSVEALQREMGMSRMQLHRKLKALTDQSASDFIRHIRLQRAADLLQQPGIQIAEAAYLSGFNHLSYFSKCFKEQFGMQPSEFAKQKGEKVVNDSI